MIEMTRSILIEAPVQKCFDLARDVDDHIESMKHTGERVVGGRTGGLLDLGDEMTLEARHLGFRFRMTAKITEMEAPHRFVDEMVSGPFKSLWHEHLFQEEQAGVRLTDTMRVAAPLGPLGLLAERAVLRHVLSRVLESRQTHLKCKAECQK